MNKQTLLKTSFETISKDVLKKIFSNSYFHVFELTIFTVQMFAVPWEYCAEEQHVYFLTLSTPANFTESFTWIPMLHSLNFLVTHIYIPYTSFLTPLGHINTSFLTLFLVSSANSEKFKLRILGCLENMFCTLKTFFF